MEPLVERLRGSGEIVLDDSRDFTLSKDEAVKFVIERRGEPYWLAYKVGSPTEPVLLKAIELYEMMMGWGDEIQSASATVEYERDATGSIVKTCLLYTSDAADDLTRVDLVGRSI